MKVEDKPDPTFCYQSTFKNAEMLSNHGNSVNEDDSSSKSTTENTVNGSTKSTTGATGAREKKKVMFLGTDL